MWSSGWPWDRSLREWRIGGASWSPTPRKFSLMPWPTGDHPRGPEGNGDYQLCDHYFKSDSHSFYTCRVRGEKLRSSAWNLVHFWNPWAGIGKQALYAFGKIHACFSNQCDRLPLLLHCSFLLAIFPKAELQTTSNAASPTSWSHELAFWVQGWRLWLFVKLFSSFRRKTRPH